MSSSLQERNQKFSKKTPTMTSSCVLSRRNCLEGISATRIEPVVLKLYVRKKARHVAREGEAASQFPEPPKVGKDGNRMHPVSSLPPSTEVGHRSSSTRALEDRRRRLQTATGYSLSSFLKGGIHPGFA